MARIYLASSWRNARQPVIVDTLRRNGHAVYDFRNPGGVEVKVGENLGHIYGSQPTRIAPGLGGFSWSELDPKWKDWDAATYRQNLLENPIASHGFNADKRAMDWADTCLLLLPSGRSAHLEAGFMAGQGKRTLVLLEGACEPELMNLLLDDICADMVEVLKCLREGQ